MCTACAAEYHDPADRRFHAQPVCCPDCGPTLRLLDADGNHLPGDPITTAARMLADGAVLAVKGLGGYHLAALAGHEQAVAELRARKHREDKPFAVLAPGLDAAAKLGQVGPAEARELTSRRAPIVLLRRRLGAPLAAAVAPGNDHVGVMLPYTPVHHLLLDELAVPIVLTSGNLSDEPIAHLDDDALARLGGIAEAFLTHDRPIRTRADDSVLRVVAGRTYPIRRSRGYTPEPLRIAVTAPEPVLGCGAELKNTFCILRGAEAFPSHHVGDLENAETLRAYTDGIEHLGRLLDVTPAVLAHDLHPEYLSTKYALDRAAAEPGVRLVGVQHHHAHLAACLAENGEAGPAIGIACDGLGYGPDGVLWGGEVLEVSLTGFRRLAHLEPVPLPGGATAIRQPWRMAAAWLHATGTDPAGLAVAIRNGPQWTQVEKLLASDVEIAVTTSAGRLFDAVAALVGIRDRVNYEGQAAIELEQCASVVGECDGYPVGFDGGLIRAGDLVRAVVADLRIGAAVPLIAARFHAGLHDALAAAAVRAAAGTGLDVVALSGGVFQNLRLLHGVSRRLTEAGLRVLVHSRMPCNDGGISLGQVAVAAARTARR
jgi:hydrogenase maturation protein HypF